MANPLSGFNFSPNAMMQQMMPVQGMQQQIMPMQQNMQQFQGSQIADPLMLSSLSNFAMNPIQIGAGASNQANSEFLMTLNQTLAPAQGQVAGALQLVQTYQVRQQQEAQNKAMLTQLTQLVTLLGQQAAAAPAAVAPVAGAPIAAAAVAPATGAALPGVSGDAISQLVTLLTSLLGSMAPAAAAPAPPSPVTSATATALSNAGFGLGAI